MQLMSEPRPWWHPDKHADRRAGLLARNRIKAAIRQWLEREGFIEIDAACLQVSPGNEAHLAAFRTEFKAEGGDRRAFYLHTSPEFACKKLLAAGETKVFTFAPVFRNGERGPLHSPEFTMLEWYRVGEPYTRLWADCERFLALAAEAAGTPDLTWRDRAVPANSGMDITTVCHAFSESAGIDLAATLGDEDVDREALAIQVSRAGLRVADDDTWSDLFSRALVERVEPALARSRRPVILSEYPTHEAALARPTGHAPRLAERFELYACGVELANGFGELTDPVEQRRRFEAEMAEKERIYGERYPLDEDFLAALACMPPASGCAFGFDRLVMLATGASQIEQVLWTPVAS
jgi:elongation factor P--(R)-beta-lysine ligase